MVKQLLKDIIYFIIVMYQCNAIKLMTAHAKIKPNNCQNLPTATCCLDSCSKYSHHAFVMCLIINIIMEMFVRKVNLKIFEKCQEICKTFRHAKQNKTKSKSAERPIALCKWLPNAQTFNSVSDKKFNT